MHELNSKDSLNKMQEISSTFYYQAVQLGIHPFIEFAGMMNEYIKMANQSWDKGVDFTQTNIHSDAPGLVAYGFNGDYLAEKFECIFGKTFFDSKEFKLAFLEKMGFPVIEANEPVEFKNNIVPIEYLEKITEERDKINKMELSKITWTKNGVPIKIDPKIKADWEFTGLNNTYFITDGFYLTGFVEKVSEA